MKRYVFGMANLVPRRTGLSADIWVEHKGIERRVEHNTPRVKISYSGESISISIDSNPNILSGNSTYNNSHGHSRKAFDEAIAYVADNYDLFLTHFNDVGDNFDDRDLEDALANRGFYRK